MKRSLSCILIAAAFVLISGRAFADQSAAGGYWVDDIYLPISTTSSTGNVSNVPAECMAGNCEQPVDAGNVFSQGYGYSDSGSPMLGVYAESTSRVTSQYGPYASSSAETLNHFTVQPGTAGLASGDTLRMILNLQLDGLLQARSTGRPNYGDTKVDVWGHFSITDPASGHREGEAWVVDTPVSFDMSATSQAGSSGAYYTGPENSTGSWDYRWEASTNTGMNPWVSDTGGTYNNADGGVSVSTLNFNTGSLPLTFDVIVGNEYEVNADLNAYSWANGDASSKADFLHTFKMTDLAALDSSNSGIAIQWEHPAQNAAVPEPSTLLLMSSGLAGVAALRRKFRKTA